MSHDLLEKSIRRFGIRHLRQEKDSHAKIKNLYELPLGDRSKWRSILQSAGLFCLILRLSTREDMFGRSSFWMVGGDGWAYDIGYGGLDHVIASEASRAVRI